jgi:hypothetical protein
MPLAFSFRHFVRWLIVCIYSISALLFLYLLLLCYYCDDLFKLIKENYPDVR